MAKSKNNLMLDFLVTFFIEDQAISRMLSDVLKKQNESPVSRNIGTSI